MIADRSIQNTLIGNIRQVKLSILKNQDISSVPNLADCLESKLDTGHPENCSAGDKVLYSYTPLEIIIRLGRHNILSRVNDIWVKMDAKRLLWLADLVVSMGNDETMLYNLYIIAHKRTPTRLIEPKDVKSIALKILSSRGMIFHILGFNNEYHMMKKVKSHFPEIRSYIHLAIRPGNEDFIEEILKNGFQPDETITFYYLPQKRMIKSNMLHYAILTDQFIMVTLLIHYGATITADVFKALFEEFDVDNMSDIVKMEVREKTNGSFSVRYENEIGYERDILYYLNIFHEEGFKEWFLCNQLFDSIIKHSQGVFILEFFRRVGTKIDFDELIKSILGRFKRNENEAEQICLYCKIIPYLDFLLEEKLDNQHEAILIKLLRFDHQAFIYYYNHITVEQEIIDRIINTVTDNERRKDCHIIEVLRFLRRDTPVLSSTRRSSCEFSSTSISLLVSQEVSRRSSTL